MDALGVFLLECDAMPTSSHIRSVYASLHYGFLNQRTRWIWGGVDGDDQSLALLYSTLQFTGFRVLLRHQRPIKFRRWLPGCPTPSCPIRGRRPSRRLRDHHLGFERRTQPDLSQRPAGRKLQLHHGVGALRSLPCREYFRRVVLGLSDRCVRDPQTISCLRVDLDPQSTPRRYSLSLASTCRPIQYLLRILAGAIYDDLFLIDSRLLLSRFEDVTLAACILALSLVVRAVYLSGHAKIRYVLLILMVLGAQHTLARQEGVYRDAKFIQDTLGGHHQTEHFDIYYPETWSQKRIQRLGFELEFGHQRLTQFFGDKPTHRISAYFYSNMNQKKALMGARRTRIAKPWQWAFHIHRPSIGQDVIVHEMAHVFAAMLGHSPHHLSLGPYGLPNMGIIEGVAEAATWPQGQLDLHQWSAAMQSLRSHRPSLNC